MENKKFLAAKLVNVKDTKVERVRMPYRLKRSAMQMQANAVNTNIQIEMARMKLRRPFVEGRSEDAGADLLDSVIIKNLIYNGKQEIFKGKVFSS